VVRSTAHNSCATDQNGSLTGSSAAKKLHIPKSPIPVTLFLSQILFQMPGTEPSFQCLWRMSVSLMTQQDFSTAPFLFWRNQFQDMGCTAKISGIITVSILKVDCPMVPAHTHSTSAPDHGNRSTQKTDYTGATNCCEIPYFPIMFIYLTPFLTDSPTTMPLLRPPFPPISFSSDPQGWLRSFSSALWGCL
jgi:hypothetical protein